MGAWGTKPWDNDSAADWFDALFDATELRKKVREALEMDIDDDHEKVRAAAAVLLMLGRLYIWPTGHLDDDIRLAIRQLEYIKKHDHHQGRKAFLAEIQREIDALRNRLKGEGRHYDDLDAQAWWLSWR